MESYLYPTQPSWFGDLLNDWKTSGKRTFSFPFLRFEPTTLPKDSTAPFWMYLYYSETQTADRSLRRVVEFRVRVIASSTHIIQGAGIYTHIDQQEDAKVWFQCDLAEQIKAVGGGPLHASDFESVKGVNLLPSIRNSIAAVRRISPMVTVQSTWHCVND